jgi:hypothetical protein
LDLIFWMTYSEGPLWACMALSEVSLSSTRIWLKSTPGLCEVWAEASLVCLEFYTSVQPVDHLNCFQIFTLWNNIQSHTLSSWQLAFNNRFFFQPKGNIFRTGTPEEHSWEGQKREILDWLLSIPLVAGL